MTDATDLYDQEDDLGNYGPRNCDYVTEAWGPNEGCREFMSEPETFACGERATHYVIVKNFEQHGNSVEALCVCAEHSDEIVGSFPSPWAELLLTGNLERGQR